MLLLHPLDTARDWKGSTDWKREDRHKQVGAKVKDGNSQKQVVTTFSMGNFGNRARNRKLSNLVLVPSVTLS